MKIHILNVSKQLQPSRQPFTYPSFNHDYGVEQDMLSYLLAHQELLTSLHTQADWHYLPVYWTRWHLLHNYGKEGLPLLSSLVNSTIISSRKTFTVCQYDDGPVISLPKVRTYLASRKSNTGYDIPLLCKPHNYPWLLPSKQYLASFIGRLSTHKIRSVMSAKLANQDGFYIVDGDLGRRTYVSTMLRSYVALCPRGYGGSSYRFYEAMQLGVVPFLIGEIDTRPFKKYIDWDAFSFYSNNVNDVKSMICQKSKDELLQMGNLARHVWKHKIRYRKWESHVIRELTESLEYL